MRSPVSRLRCVTLMRFLSATMASYKDTHSRSPSIICPLSLCRAPVQSQRGSVAERGARLYHCFIFLCSSCRTPLTTQRWFMAPADRHSQQTSAVRVVYSRDWLSCLPLLWHFWNVISLNSVKGVRPQRKQPPAPVCILPCIVLAYLCSGLLGKLISLSSCKTLPRIKPSLCDLLYPCYKQRHSLMQCWLMCQQVFCVATLSRHHTVHFILLLQQLRKQ